MPRDRMLCTFSNLARFCTRDARTMVRNVERSRAHMVPSVMACQGYQPTQANVATTV